MDICGADHVAALHTMILLDPDLDPDPAPDTSKGATLHDPPQLERHRRMPSARALGLFLREAQAAVRLRGLVSVLLTTDTEIRRLNRTFRGKNKATDVLSFPAARPSQVSEARPGAPAPQLVSGDLAISVETARRQAAEQGHPLAVEVKVLMLHGLLHLAGYDHEADEGQMARRERVLRARLKLPQGLIERGGLPTLATEKSRKDGARTQSAGFRSPTLGTRRNRKDVARSVSAKPVRGGRA
jgi:probable rRNA maturation factor